MGNTSSSEPRTANSPCATTWVTAAYPANVNRARSPSKSSASPTCTLSEWASTKLRGASRCSSVSTATNHTPFLARGSSASVASRAEVMSGWAEKPS